MDNIPQVPPISDLEGLLLRDDAGAYYALPCAVLERYQVPSEQLADFTQPGDIATAAPPCRIVRGIYASYATKHETRRAL
jgi:hypothetical protein